MDSKGKDRGPKINKSRETKERGKQGEGITQAGKKKSVKMIKGLTIVTL